MLVVVLLVTLAVGGGMLYLVRTLDDRIARKIDPLVRAAIRDAAAAAERAGNEGGDKLAGALLTVGNEMGARLSVARAEREQLRDQLARIDVKLADIRDLLEKTTVVGNLDDGTALDGEVPGGEVPDDTARDGGQAVEDGNG
jgi:hypothetical protein